jgi:uncharacterized Zn finger protein
MSSWDDSRWFTPARKKAPPEDGIKMKKAGTTWWGQRWIEALANVLRGDSGRLARGRTYARAGRTHDLTVKDGKVSAKVTGSRATPYEITIQLAQLPAAAWTNAIASMAEKAQFSAELLAGQMPKEIDEAFRAADTSLFPRQRSDLVTTCTCPDWGDPCKHVAAAHYVLGEAIDRDPFLLFELRGRTREHVLDALRAARGGDDAAATNDARAAKQGSELTTSEVPKVAFGKVKAADYDRARGELPAMHFSFDAPVAHGAVLRQLGVPGAWGADSSPADTLSPLIRRAAEAARRIAMAESEPQVAPDADAVTNEPARKRPAKPRVKTAKAGRAPKTPKP